MNGDILEKQLPELSDEDVRTLWKICQRATASEQPQYLSIYNSYDVVLAQEGRKEKHDPVIFRWVNHLARILDQRNNEGDHVTLLGVCREILSANQIFLEGDDEDEADDQAQPERHVHFERRSSFDDARYEETWLSENTQTLDVGTPGYDALRPAAQRGREAPLNGHIRANSLPNGSLSATRLAHKVPLSVRQRVQEDLDTPVPELEEQADAMLDIRDIRMLRSLFVQWRTALHSLEARQAYDQDRAATHDAMVLQKQVWDTWAVKAVFRLQRRRVEQHEIFLETCLQGSIFDLRRRYLMHWRNKTNEIRGIVAARKTYMLASRYFKRWRSIAQENATRTRSIVLQKYLTKWHQASLAQRTEPESADRICKRLLLRKAFSKLKQRKLQCDAQKHYLVSLQRDTLAQWNDRVQRSVRRVEQAGQHAIKTLLHRVLSRLNTNSASVQSKIVEAVTLHDQHLRRTGFNTVIKQGELYPRLRTYQSDVRIFLQQKVLDTLHEAARLATQASTLRKDHLRKHTLRSLGDTLRIRTMSHQIDDRLKADCLYLMLLHERVRLFQRNRDERLKHHLFGILKQKAVSRSTTIEAKLERFKQEAQRRALMNAFQQVHVTMRSREQSEQSALDLDRTKTCPRIGMALLASHKRYQTMQKWSSDAYYFVTAKRVLHLWRNRVIKSKQDKHRSAYEHCRSLIKQRLMRYCFGRITSVVATRRKISSEAAPFDDSRMVGNASRSLSLLGEALLSSHVLQAQAVQHDRVSLLRSGLTAMSARQGYLEQNEELAKEYKDSIDQAEALLALRRLRFATLASSARLIDSGRMLQERLTQKRCHQILQHMAAVATQRATARREDTGLGQEPESPSARPASRAASRSASRLPQSTIRTSPRSGTPAYLRTPARGRKGRFRPLPTPAPITPFTFTPGVLTSTPLRGPEPADESSLFEATSTTPQITPFDRKLRAGGVGPSSNAVSSLRRSVLTRSVGRGAPSTSKSVRFLGGSRIGRRVIIEDDTML